MKDNEEVQRFIDSARRDNASSFDMVEKNAFTLFISGMKIKMLDKLIKKDSEEIKKQIASLERMESFLDRLTFKNCVFHFQAKIILSQDRRIIVLEQEKLDLISRAKEKFTDLNKTIDGLESEVKNLKKNIK